MAIARFNSLTQGISGTIGNLVFRQIGSKTIITGKPDKLTKGELAKQSELQRKNRSKFKDAAMWAKFAVLDAERKAYYLRKAKKLKLPNAYTAAVCDYMRRGEIKEVDTRQYKGKAGNVIRLKIQKKDFAVHKVRVSLRYADGNVIESDMAIKKDHDVFLYKVTQTLQDKVPITIVVTVADHWYDEISKKIAL